MGWISPTGFVDSGSVWTSEALAYDENTGTYAYATALKSGWTDYLELTHAALGCDKVQIWVSINLANINALEVDVYYSSAWHNIYSGAITVGQFVEYAIGSTESVTAMRIRFYSTKASTDGCMVHEADFNEVIVGTTYYGAATLSGVGALAGIGALIKYGKTALSGIGTVVATAVQTLVGKATLSGTGSLSALGGKILTGLATLSGSGSLSAIGGVFKLGATTLAGAGTLVASAVMTVVGKATLSGTGVLSGIGGRILAGVVTLSGVGSLAGKAALVLIGKVVLGGVGAFSAIGEIATGITHYGVAALSGLGIFTVKAIMTHGRILRIFTEATVCQQLHFESTISKPLLITRSFSKELRLKSNIVEK